MIGCMSSTDQHEQRARELMLSADSTRRFIAIAMTGYCPDCKRRIERYEHKQVQHARLTCLARKEK